MGLEWRVIGTRKEREGHNQEGGRILRTET